MCCAIIDEDSHCLVIIGSKEGLVKCPLCVLAVQNPSYFINRQFLLILGLIDPALLIMHLVCNRNLFEECAIGINYSGVGINSLYE